ncbi:MAG TPA: SMC-Scp complex subunit ScpB [Limnochordia bacterium]
MNGSLPIDPSPAALEAVLFAAARPLRTEELARILGIDPAGVLQLIAALEEAYAAGGRGLIVERVAQGYQLCTHPDLAPYITRVDRPCKTSGLSQAALEVLAIVAYRQPVTRAEIDALRGVRSDAAIASLLERELIEEVDRAGGPGRPIRYGTTEAFLVHLGLDSLTDLPPVPGIGGEGEGKSA